MKLKAIDQHITRLVSSIAERLVFKKNQLISPAARLLLVLNDISADLITPSGPKGHILKGDVLQHLRRSMTAQQFPRQVSMMVVESDLKQIIRLFDQTNQSRSLILAQVLCKCFAMASGNPMLPVRIHQRGYQIITKRLGEHALANRFASSDPFLDLYVDLPAQESSSAAVASIQSTVSGDHRLSITIHRDNNLDSTQLMKLWHKYLNDPLLLLL